MIMNENKFKSMTANLSNEEIVNIKYYVKGAVYSFCNNCKDNKGSNLWFSIHTLFGKKDRFWKDPLVSLYDYYINIGKTHKAAVLSAGKDLGVLLKEVLIEDDRVYQKSKEQRKYLINSYRLISASD